MNKEELEKEARINLKRRFGEFFPQLTISYVMGAEPREKHIKECEQLIETQDRKLRQLSKECDDAIDRVENLVKENEGLKSECRTCVYTDSPCVRSDYPSKDGICSHYKNVFDEIAELKKNYEDSLVACGVLKARVDTLAQPSPLESMQDVLITTQKAQNEKQREQLTKAKEIIDDLVHLGEFNEHTDEEYVNYQVHEALKNAEQFLKEIE